MRTFFLYKLLGIKLFIGLLSQSPMAISQIRQLTRVTFPRGLGSSLSFSSGEERKRKGENGTLCFTLWFFLNSLISDSLDLVQYDLYTSTQPRN